jgi:hypothetical protein
MQSVDELYGNDTARHVLTQDIDLNEDPYQQSANETFGPCILNVREQISRSTENLRLCDLNPQNEARFKKYMQMRQAKGSRNSNLN